MVTIFVTAHAGAVTFRANEPLTADYGVLRELPRDFGTGEFTLELRVKLNETYPVGRTVMNTIAQTKNWSSADPEPYSRDDWWWEGNFLLDGHNNNAFEQGTFSIQFYGGGRVRWDFGDGTVAGPGGHWSVQAYPSGATPSLLDGKWHWIALVRRWAGESGADLELWVDGGQVAVQRTPVRTDMRRWWDGFPGYRDGEQGWFWGEEMQAALGTIEQFEDFKGELMELRFWSKALSPQELAATTEVTKEMPGLVGLYRLPVEFGGTVCNELTGGECIEFKFSDRRAGAVPLRMQDWAGISGFFGAALLALVCAARRGFRTSSGRPWLGIAVVLAVLATITWLELGMFAEQSLRRLSREGGWYAWRRVPQVALILAIAAGLIVLYRRAIHASGAADRATRAALAVCGILVLIAAARAGSFTYADSILNWGGPRLSAGRVAEMAGALVIAIGAFFAWNRNHLAKQD